MMCRVFDKLDILEARLNKQNRINEKFNYYLNKVNKRACLFGLMGVWFSGYVYAKTTKTIQKQATKIEELEIKFNESEEMKG